MSGFIFNNKHSYDDYGMITRIKNRPILPEPKIIVDEIPCMDGDYDFSESNPDKRMKYKPRPIDVDCTFKDKDLKYLRIKAHQIAAWLACGEKPLIFDDETAIFYLARIINRLDLETQIARLGFFTIQFKCRPFAFSRVKSNEQLQFGQGIMFGYEYRLCSPTAYTVLGNTTLNVYNPGTYVKPIIRINGSLQTVSFVLNGKTLTYGTPLSGAQLEINCAKYEAVKDGAINVLNYLSGDWLEFSHGDNTLQVTGSGMSFNLTLEFNYLYF